MEKTVNKSICVLLYSALPQKIQGGIAVWTHSFLVQAEKNGIICSLVNNAAIRKRADNPEAKISVLDEIIRTNGILRSLKKTINEKEFDVAHVNTSCGPMGIIRDSIVVNKLKRKKIKVITHFHCDIPFWINNRVSKFFLKRLVCHSDLLFVLCSNSSNYIKTEFGRDSVFLPNFINKNSVVKRKRIQTECKNVLYVGGIQPDKGCFEIFQTAKECPDLNFVLVGQKSAGIEKELVPANVIFTGVLCRDRVLEEMDNCDVFLFPSHSEGFSLSLLEAMSRGLPIITTDVGANLQMIEASGGIIVPTNDVISIVNALQEIKKPEVRERMSQWNIQKVLSSYTSEKVFALLRETYKSM